MITLQGLQSHFFPVLHLLFYIFISSYFHQFLILHTEYQKDFVQLKLSCKKTDDDNGLGGSNNHNNNDIYKFNIFSLFNVWIEISFIFKCITWVNCKFPLIEKNIFFFVLNFQINRMQCLLLELSVLLHYNEFQIVGKLTIWTDHFHGKKNISVIMWKNCAKKRIDKPIY